MTTTGSNVIPINRPRKRTNTITLVVFSIFIIFYIGITAYAYIKGDIRKVKLNHQPDNRVIKDILDKLGQSKWILLGTLCISTITTAICLLIVRAISRIVIIIGLILLFLLLLSSIGTLFVTIFNLQAAQIINQLISTFIMSCLIYVQIFAIMRCGTHLLSGVIKEACRAVFSFPFAMLLPIAVTLLIALVAVNTIAVSVYLLSINMESMPAYLGLFHFINFYTGIWLLLALGAFVLMVLYRMFGTWFYTLDKSDVPHDTLLSSVSIVTRYHVGTLAFATSICAPFAVLYTMFSNLRNVGRDTRYNIIVMAVCWINIFGKISDSAVGVSGIYGSGFMKTANRVCQLYLRHPLRFIGIQKAFECCTVTWLMLTAIVVMPVYAAFLFKQNMTDTEAFVAVTVVAFGWILTIIPLFLIFTAAVTALTVCMFEDYERCQQDRSATPFTKTNLRELMTIE